MGSSEPVPVKPVFFPPPDLRSAWTAAIQILAAVAGEVPAATESVDFGKFAAALNHVTDFSAFQHRNPVVFAEWAEVKRVAREHDTITNGRELRLVVSNRDEICDRASPPGIRSLGPPATISAFNLRPNLECPHPLSQCRRMVDFVYG